MPCRRGETIRLKWTDAQRQAIDAPAQRVLVSAGAGSGKTRVLVERFLKLLEENRDCRINEIVAVTFTEKAAREMVSRIRREIRLRIETAGDSKERERWRLHRNGLDSARIGTIHSLCAAILRSHTAEAGVDPLFRVLDETQAMILLDRAVEETLEQIASADIAPADVSEIEIFAYLSPRSVRSMLRDLILQGDQSRCAIKAIERMNPPETLEFWSQRLQAATEEAALNVVRRKGWRLDVELIRSRRAINRWDKREQCRAQVVDLLTRIESTENGSRPVDGLQIARLLVELDSAINLRGGSAGRWASEDDFKSVGEALSRLRLAIRREKVLGLEINGSDAAAARAVCSLIRIVERVRARFSLLKRAETSLDFNDLEELTERLLSSHGEVRDQYIAANAGVIRALMVDEFQDTSPIQKRILWMLSPLSGSLFLIGDSKQSIYRFRGADVTLFEDVRREFESAPAEVETAVAGLQKPRRQSGRAGEWVNLLLPFPVEPQSRVITLADCFRTHSGLVAFLNHLFSSAFTAETQFDIAYQPLRASKDPPAGSTGVEIHIVAQGGEREGRLSIDGLRRAEAALIASRIRELIESKAPVYDHKPAGAAEVRPVEYGDFALLFQVSTNFDVYEEALADHSIPYVTIAGRGFYDRQEITDISNLLGFLASPIDDLRLAAALRSPLFALSDETLVRLRQQPVSLWESLCSDASADGVDEREPVEFARSVLSNLRSSTGRTRPYDLISAALSETGYLATLLALPNGERRCANIEKLLEQARSLRSLSLSDFVTHIDNLKLREAREGEATIEETGAVRLMTVHKAKGLEFPVVWIADACYWTSGDPSMAVVHATFGIGIDVRVAPDRPGEAEKPAVLETIRGLTDQMERAERKRLLYVAATRARDCLFISGGVRTRIGSDTWLGMITEALGIRQGQEIGSSLLGFPGGEVLFAHHDAAVLLQAGKLCKESYASRCWDNTEHKLEQFTEISMARFPLINSTNRS